MSKTTPSRSPFLRSPSGGPDMGRGVTEVGKLLTDVWRLLRRELAKTDSYVAGAARHLRLRVYSAKVATDADNTKWVAEVREQVRQGVPEEQLIGKDELAELKRAAKAGP
jgi:hypothetical protein